MDVPGKKPYIGYQINLIKQHNQVLLKTFGDLVSLLVLIWPNYVCSKGHWNIKYASRQIVLEEFCWGSSRFCVAIFSSFWECVWYNSVYRFL